MTYVTVEDDDDDAVVYAAAAAYTGVMIAWGCAVWGTGYYYPPYYYGGGYYPAYYGRYPSYGYGASYNPWTGAYTRGASVHGPYGGAGMAARYNPRSGTYSRAAGAYGPYGATGVAQAYNPRTGTYAGTRQGSNAYGSWGSTSVQRGDQWAQTARVTNNRGTTTRVTQGSGGGTAVSRSGTRGEQRSARAAVATSTRGTTATSTGKGKTAAGRSTTTAVGATWISRTPQQREARRTPARRHVTKPGPASRRLVSSIVAQLLVSSTVTRVHAIEAPSAPTMRVVLVQGSGSGGYSGSYRPSGGGGRSRPSGGGGEGGSSMTDSTVSARPGRVQTFEPSSPRDHATISVSRSIIYEQGWPASEFFLLTTGRARYFSSLQTAARCCCTGSFRVTSSAWPRYCRTPSTYRVSAETVKDSSMLIWDRPTHAGAPRPVSAPSSQCVGSRRLVSGSCTSPRTPRWSPKLLGSASRRAGQARSGDWARSVGGVELQVTNEELASAANITLFTASRILSEWQARTCSTKRRGRIILHLPERLFKTAVLLQCKIASVQRHPNTACHP